jgi:Flp pilus assembly protein TadG
MTSKPEISSHRRQHQRGNALVESGLVMLVFMVMILGLTDFGRMVWSYTMVAHGAREVTRYAVVHGSDSGTRASVSDIQGIVTSRSPGLDPANTTTTVIFAPDQSAGSTVTVGVAYNFYPLTPYVPVGPIKLVSASQMVIYQ